MGFARIDQLIQVAEIPQVSLEVGPPFHRSKIPRVKGKKGVCFFTPKKRGVVFYNFWSNIFLLCGTFKVFWKTSFGRIVLNKQKHAQWFDSKPESPSQDIQIPPEVWCFRHYLLSMCLDVYGIKSWKHLSINPDPGRNDAIWRMCIFFDGFVGKKNAAPEINSRFTFSNHRKNISEIKDTYGGGMDIH